MSRARLVMTALYLAASPVLGELPEHPAIGRGDVPAWVEPHQPRLDTGADAGTALQYLLFDRQVRLPSAGEPPQDFSRLVYRIASQGGLEEGSSWEVDFDPSYERLVVHSLRVYRDGTWKDRLEGSRSSLLHREDDLHRQVFDQRLTLLLILDDVRVGDVVAVDYTVEGTNPVFEPYFTGSYELRWSTGVEHAHLRVLSAPGRRLAHRVHGSAPEGRERRRRDGWNELVWDERGVPGVDYEDYAPAYFVQYAFVQVSEFATWDEVVEWAAPLFLSGFPPPELVHVAEEIRAAHAAAGERIVAARDWVEEEIRYFSVAMGEHSHAPHDAAEVLRRRYGDCKDKSVLLAQLLWLLDVEAAPAFVSTELGRRIADYLPDPTVFDHVVVVAFLDGGEVWIDPTLAHQGGALGEDRRLYVPPYELGLVIGRVDVSGLRRIPEEQSAPGVTTARYVYELGPERKASVSIATTYQDDGAEDFRELLASQSGVEILEGYVESYADDLYQVEPIGDLDVQDDVGLNRLKVTERYRLRYQGAGGDDPTSFETLPLLLSWELEEPPDTDRRTPFAVAGPSRYHEEVVIFTDEDVELEEVEAREENPWFQFQASSRHIHERGRDALEITYELKTLAGEVAPGDVADYAAAVGRMTQSLGYVVRDSPKEDLRAFAVLVLAAVALFSGSLCTLVLLLMRRWGFLRPRSYLAAGEGRARAASLAIRAVLVVAGLEAVLTIAAVLSLAGMLALSDQGWGQLERAIDLLVRLEIAAFLAAAVFFVRWQNEVLRTARAVGDEDLLYGVRLAAASWFVPVLNAFVPFQSLRQAAGVGRGPGDADTKALVGLWWGLCGLWFVLWSASLVLSLWVDGTRPWIAVSALNTASTATLLVTGSVVLLLLRALSRRGEEDEAAG